MAAPTVAAMAARGAAAVSIAPVTLDVHVPSITPFTYTPIHRTDCVTMTPDPSGFVPPQACNALWEYFPSMAAAVIFSIIFGVLLITHTTQAVVYKKVCCISPWASEANNLEILLGTPCRHLLAVRLFRTSQPGRSRPAKQRVGDNVPIASPTRSSMA
jgi:hypothetical protein